MLPEPRRERVAGLIEKRRGMPDLANRKNLAELRSAEADDLRRRLELPPSARLERLSPPLRRWLESKVEIGDGREDHQG
jgi:hypothetical protein